MLNSTDAPEKANPQIQKATVALKDGTEAEMQWGDAASEALRMNPTAFTGLLKAEVAATYDPPQIILQNTRARCRDLLAPAEVELGKVSRAAGTMLKKILDGREMGLYPGGWTETDEVKWTVEDAEKLQIDGKFAVLNVGKTMVGCAAYKQKLLPSGVTFYEITKLSTLPEFRGRGVNGFLRKKVLDMMGVDSKSVIVSCTKSVAEISNCEKAGWIEIDFEKYLLLQRLANAEWTPEMIERGRGKWRAFIYDPSNLLHDITSTNKYEESQRSVTEFQFDAVYSSSNSQTKRLLGMNIEDHKKFLQELIWRYDEEAGLRKYFECVQFLAPWGFIRDTLSQYYDTTKHKPSEKSDPDSLENFDPASPIFTWVHGPEDFALNKKRNAYEDVRGRKFCGPNNAGFVQKKEGRDGKPFEQVVALICNHGEQVPMIRWLRRNGFFGDPHRSLRLRQGDGHADATGANSAHIAGLQEKNASAPINFLESTITNDHRDSISSHNVSLIETGDFNAENMLLKSGIDSWNNGDADAGWYRMAHRFHGATGTVILDVEPENDIVTDSQVEAQKCDVASLDMDRQYYEQTPEDIAWSIRKEVHIVADDPLVILVPSPGWLDEEIGLLLCQIKAELLKAKPNRKQVLQYVKKMYKRMMVMGGENEAKGILDKRGKIHYAYFAEVAKTGDDKVHERQSSDLNKMVSILLDEPCTFNRAPDTDACEVSYYNEPLGTYGTYIQNRRVGAALERTYGLLPALKSSPCDEIRALAQNFHTLPPITDKELVQYGLLIKDIDQEQAKTAKQEGAPVDMAIEKIVYDLEHRLGTICEKNGLVKVLEHLTILLRILKSNVTRKPVTIQREIQAWFSRFGSLTSLYSYPYSDFQGQTNTWRLRCASINGPFSDFGDADSLTMKDIRSILEVGGGGSVTIAAVNATEASNKANFTFSYGMHDPRRQTAAEILADIYVNGYFFTDASGKIVTPVDNHTEGLSRWNIVERNTADVKQECALKSAVGQYFKVSSYPTRSPSSTEANLSALSSLHDELLAARKEIKIPTYDIGTDLDSHKIERDVLTIGEHCYRSLRSWNCEKGKKELHQLFLELSKENLPPALLPLARFCINNRSALEATTNMIEKLWQQEMTADEMRQHPVTTALKTMTRRAAIGCFVAGGVVATAVGGSLGAAAVINSMSRTKQSPEETLTDKIVLTDEMGFIPIESDARYREAWKVDNPNAKLIELFESSFVEHARWFPDICHTIRNDYLKRKPTTLSEEQQKSMSWMLTLYHLARLRSMDPGSSTSPDKIKTITMSLIKIAYADYVKHEGRGRSTTPDDGFRMFLELYEKFSQRVSTASFMPTEVIKNNNPLNRMQDSQIQHSLRANGYFR